MNFPTPLVPATLVRRYKRFLADCQLGDGEIIIAHCPNPGSMAGLAAPGQQVWLEPNSDPKKKLNYGWRLVDHENGHFTGIDTSIPNKVVRAALEAREIAGLDMYETVIPEVKYSENSRIDFLLTQPGLRDCYVEVKSVTLMREPGLAEFPDCVTKRGTKHLNDLKQMVEQGHRAVILYLVQRTDCDRFALASDIDPEYAQSFEHALRRGVEPLVYSCRVGPNEIAISKPLALQSTQL